MKILTLVHTCLAYEQIRAAQIWESWANDLEDFFFICDSEKFSLPKRIYLGPYPKGPTYHPATLIKIFYLFNSENFKHYEWLFIVDDDSYVYMPKLEKFLEFYDSNSAVILGDFLNWPKFHPTWAKADYSFWVGGGSGIVFSRSATLKLMEYASIFQLPAQNHDVWIHQLMALNATYEIQRIHAPGFHQYGSDHLYKHQSLDSNFLISLHLNHNMDLIRHYMVSP